ncbi:hypothetical protein [Francisella sp. TX07-6608]|uniref:hypothetical protein n=1 Tax=Francisella sp. TX07-6608 TaxID=573568 RepID=UPI0009243246|nr:hypothetical protein [Francisella sp. TX07-6608]OIN84878.1 ureide permease family protein [Francisella sp. TX07-6608]
MVVLHSYGVAVFFCIITMLCWGSWANTQKLPTKEWPFQQYYWDYGLGILIVPFVLAITMRSFGTEVRSFFSDISQASSESFIYAFMGGVVFNLANILLVAAIDIAGGVCSFPFSYWVSISYRCDYKLYSNTSRSACSFVFRSFERTCSNYY